MYLALLTLPANKEVKNLTLITSCAESQDIPLEFCLNQNHPNPFKKKTIIKYGIPYKTKVILIVHNSLGNILEKLISKEQNAGVYEVEFTADGLPEGTYFYQLITDKFATTKHMKLLN
jgi:hypothetical protein